MIHLKQNCTLLLSVVKRSNLSEYLTNIIKKYIILKKRMT